ncbi:MAG: uL15m family ribosomal protein [Candidatus Nanohaloarchaea archaeon]
MTKRRSKKKKSGSHGYGSSKKNRGAGNRGGRGNAGSGKKGQSKRLTKEGVQELGEKGFTSRQPDQNGINLRDIDDRIETLSEKGLVEDDGDVLVLDVTEFGYDKVLGTGHLNREIEIHAESFSSSAERKIEEAGGEAVEK